MTATAPLYVALARALQWQSRVNEHFRPQADERVRLLVKRLPHGNGIDGETIVEWNNGRILLKVSFHHMNENGFYTQWTDHVITISPSLTYGFDLKVSGKNVNDIKDYLGDLFNMALREEAPVYPEEQAVA